MSRTCLNLWGLVLGFLTLTLLACGSGGGSSTTTSSTVSAALQSLPNNYDFGYVTQSNSPAAKVITLINNGSYAVDINNITLAGDVTPGNGFSLDLNAGSNPCGVPPQTLNAGAECTVSVGYLPMDLGDYYGTLTITSNDPKNTSMSIPILGNSITIGTPKIRVNQVEANTCSSTEMTVYTSVTDQLGYPITGLTATAFSLSQTNVTPTNPVVKSPIRYVTSVTEPISVVLVMDYSSSLTSDPGAVAAMEDGVSYFVNQLSVADQAEIIKFATVVEIVQPFTSDKALLLSKVAENWDGGIYTHVYDALYQAITDVAGSSNQRRAVIVLSDGVDKPGNFSTLYTEQQVIDHASNSGVPLFTIGIGASLDRNVLTQLSDGSGGQFYDAGAAGNHVTDNLRTIYQQQAKVLFVSQYVLTYDSIFNFGNSADLTAYVTLDGGVSFEYDTRSITPCP